MAANGESGAAASFTSLPPLGVGRRSLLHGHGQCLAGADSRLASCPRWLVSRVRGGVASFSGAQLRVRRAFAPASPSFDAASTTRAAAGSDGRDLPTSGGRLIGARYGSGAVFSIEDMRREIEQKTMKYPMRSIENDIEFKSAWDENELQLCLVGFTGTGKSLRASQLKEQHGFEMAGVAELLAEDLEFGGKVEVPPGVDPLDAVEDWLGYPTDKGFKEREKTYLAEIDKQVRLNAVPELGGNFVLDTVASVAFLPQETLEVLRERYFIIHFEPSDQELKDMVEWYTAPGGKYPVVWGDFWLQRQSSEEEALRRCYPEMLRWRRQKYKELAHVNVPASLAADTDVPLQEVIDAVTNQLNAMEFLESSGLF